MPVPQSKTSWPKCQLRGRLMEDATHTEMSDWTTQGEAIKAFDAQVAKMLSHGFRVRNARRMAGTVRRAEIHNPTGGACVAIYWVVPEGANPSVNSEAK